MRGNSVIEYQIAIERVLQKNTLCHEKHEYNIVLCKKRSILYVQSDFIFVFEIFRTYPFLGQRLENMSQILIGFFTFVL